MDAAPVLTVVDCRFSAFGEAIDWQLPGLAALRKSPGTAAEARIVHGAQVVVRGRRPVTVADDEPTRFVFVKKIVALLPFLLSDCNLM
jgi:hypothetical protein